MTDKDEIIHTISPEEDIQCSTCKYRWKPILIMGEEIPRYYYGSCHAYSDKPLGILFNHEKCELYSKE